MAKYSNKVTYDIKTTLDASGITKLQSELAKVQTTLNKIASSPGKMKNLGLNIDEVQLYQDRIEKLGVTISKCFNSRTGMLDVNQFNTALKSGSLNVAELNGAFKAAGNQGKTAFNSMISMITNVNKQAVTVNSTMSKIANTFSNTVRWGITASIFQEMMSSIQGAVSYMKDLDESLTNIQMVTNSSKEDMRELALYANNAAQALGSTTTDYTNAVKVFVQEGFSEKESKQYANLSTKLANVSEQNTATTSDQITAYRNAFQLDYKQTVEAMDKVANVANNTASNVNELMTASQRAASVAQAVGSSQDSFLAAIATIQSVTRQSAEEIGNGLKTIYQRFADIKVSGKTEDGVDYGQYAKALKQIGVDVLDAQGEFKGMDQILKETQEVWSSLSETMKVAVGEKVAGKFQYNRFAALMNNQAYYEKSYAATQNASGMMDQMNEYYMQGIEGRLNTLQAAGEQVMSTLFNQDTVEPIIEDITNFVNSLNTIIEVAGGGIPVFTALSSLLLKTFSPQIATQITQIATNIMTMTQASKNMKNMQEAMILAGQMGKDLNSKTYDVANRGMTSVSGLSQASREKMVGLVQQMSEAEDKIVATENKINELASQLVSKYEQRLGLTEKEATALELELREQIQQGTLTKEQIQAVARELGLEEELVELIKLSSSEANAAAQAFREMNAATLNVNKNLEVANTAIKGFESEQIAKGFTQALSAVTSLAFGIQSITSWLSIMNDETASFEEKFNATLISLTMGLSMFGSAFTSIKTGIDAISTGLLGAERITAITAVTAATENYNKACADTVAAQTAVNIALEEGDLESAKVATTKVSEALAVEAKTKALQEEAIAQAVENGLEVENGVVTSESIKATMASVLAKKIDTAITTEGTLANALYTLSEKALGLAGIEAAAGTMSLAASIAMIAAPIAIAIAAIASIIALYIGWQESMHAASREFERQHELLSKTKKNYSDLRDEVESLKQSMDSLGETKESLKGLTKGTDEWRAAVQKLNDQILTLLQTYPELAQYVTNTDGVLDINQEGLDQFYANQLAEVRHLADVNSVQQANTLNAQNNKYIEDFYNQWGMGKGLSKEEIKTAISEGAVELKSGEDRLNAAFTELTQKVQANNVSIDKLNGTIGTLNDYMNYSAVDVNTDTTAAKMAVIEQFGAEMYDKDGNKINTESLDFSALVNNQEFLDMAAEATGKQILSAIDTSWFDDNVKFKLQNGEEIEYSSQELLQILADSKAAAEIEEQILEDNKRVYEAFGATYDETSHKFVDSAGNVITALQDLAGVTQEQAEIMSKFASDENYRKFMSGLYDGVDNFTEMIASNDYDSDKLADQSAALDAFLTNDSFQQIVKDASDGAINSIDDFAAAIDQGAINIDGLAAAIGELTPKVTDLTHNINGNEFTNRIDIASNEDSLKDILDDAEMSEGAFSRMARSSYEDSGGYYQQEKERLEGLIEVKKEDGVVTKDEQEEIKNLNSEIEGLDESARDTTAMIVNMSDGVVDLRNKIEDISEILSNEALKGTVEWYEALTDLDEGLSQVLNIDAGTLSDTFLESGDALAYAQRMAEGDMSAIDDLRKAASRDIVQNLNIQVTDEESIDELRAGLMFELNQLQADLDAGAITISTDLDTYPFINKLNEMLEKGQISAEQATQILSSIGMEANVKMVKGQGKISAIEYRPHFTGDALAVDLPWGGQINMPGIKMEAIATEIDAPMEFPVLEGVHYTGSGVQTAGVAASNPNYTGGYSNNPKTSSNKSPSSSGNNNKNNQKKEKETSEWDYLTDITNDLNRAAAAMEKLTKLEDRLFGANRVSQLKKLQSEYKNYIKLLQQEVKLAQQHAETLRTQAYDENGNLTMNGYAYRAGVGQLQFDAQGNLDNGRQIEQALLKRMNDAIDEYNEHRNDEDTGQYEWNVNQTKSDYDGFMKAMSEYESTLGKIEDSQSAIQDYKEKIQDAADSIIDAIQENLDHVIDAINNQREFDKAYQNWQEGGSDYSHFDSDFKYYNKGLEGLLSLRENNESIFNMQLNNLKDRIKDAKDILDNDSSSADDEKLSEQAAFENLKESTDSIVETLNQMVDYYDSLLKTIQEASDKMDELIDNQLKSYDPIEKKLDLRLNQIKLILGDKSYREQARIYEQEVAAGMQKLKDITAAIEIKQTTVKELEKLEENLKSQNQELSTEERQVLQDAREKITELQTESIETENQTLEAIRNQKQTTITADVNNMIQEMFNGADVDWLSQQWELATRNSEKYLDDYNRAFEIQKLELKFQEALNDNQHASLITQQKINDLANEYLTYLREKEHLSDYDVKHAQMQLDILQKQIALEDARNNKSQMQLQRNAAGNYDFVYGANEDEVNKATEALLAAQQDSYNLSKQIYLDTYESTFEAAMKVRDMVVEVAMDASLNTEQQVERIHYILENFNEYMQGSSVELGEISVNLYNSFVEASQSIAEINQGALSDIFDQMEQRAIAAQETISDTTEAINSQFISFSENANTQITGIYDNIISVVDQIQNSIIGEENGSLLNIKNGIGEFEKGFTGKEGTLDKIRVGTDTTLTDIHTKIISPVLEKIDSRFDLTEKNTLDDVKGIETAVQSTSIKITGTTTKNLDDIDKDVKDTLISIKGYIKDTSGNVETSLNGNLTRVKNGGKIVKDVYNELDQDLKNKIEKSKGYLQDFEVANEETFSAAGEDINTFIDDAVNDAKEGLNDIKQKTNDWREDLRKLNSKIGDSRQDLEKWKKKIDEAWGAADTFVEKSNSFQERLANIGGLAAYSADRFGDIRDITPEVGSSINTMENEISEGYETLQTSAENATAAFDDLKDAIGYAQQAMDNLDFNDTVRKAWDAVNDVNEAFSNMPSGADFTAHTETYVYYDNPWNWASDEYGQGIWAYYDTGGYTGKWFDEGIGADDGKLAVLHQKELVLNASDTENMLSAVELVRDIMSNINQLPSIGKNIGQNTFSDNIEQRVEISATFPGVTEAIEIKQALEQIADNAYQVANRYKY